MKLVQILLIALIGFSVSVTIKKNKKESRLEAFKTKIQEHAKEFTDKVASDWNDFASLYADVIAAADEAAQKAADEAAQKAADEAAQKAAEVGKNDDLTPPVDHTPDPNSRKKVTKKNIDIIDKSKKTKIVVDVKDPKEKK